MIQNKPFLRLIKLGVQFLFFIVGMLFILQAPALNEFSNPTAQLEQVSSIFNSDHSKIKVEQPTISFAQRVLPSVQKHSRNPLSGQHINNLQVISYHISPIPQSRNKVIPLQLSVPLNIKHCVLLI